jgi:hypothetical protein
MSAPPLLEPKIADVGVSPDLDGVLTIFDPGTAGQIVIRMDAAAAIALGQQLQQYGQRRLTRRGPPSNNAVVLRPRPDHLDS